MYFMMSYHEEEDLVSVAVTWTLVGALFFFFVLVKLKGHSDNNVSEIIELNHNSVVFPSDHRAE